MPEFIYFVVWTNTGLPVQTHTFYRSYEGAQWFINNTSRRKDAPKHYSIVRYTLDKENM